MKNYDEIIQYSNLEIAVCNIVEKKESVYIGFFDIFSPFIKENFLKNYDTFIEFAEKKNIEFNNETKNFRTGFYSMNININYNKIIEKLKICKSQLTK